MLKIHHALGILAFPMIVAGAAAFHPGHAFAQDATPKFSARAPLTSGTYKIDPMHTSVGFEVVHMGLAKIQGRYNKFDGTILVNAEDVSKSKVEFTIQADSIDTAVAPRDAHLRTADFFDVAKYPTLKFSSRSIESREGRCIASGILTIKDVTRPTEIEFHHFGPLVNDQGTRVGFIAEPLTIKRSDFGVGALDKLPNGVLAISDEIEVRLSVEALLQK